MNAGLYQKVCRRLRVVDDACESAWAQRRTLATCSPEWWEWQRICVACTRESTRLLRQKRRLRQAGASA